MQKTTVTRWLDQKNSDLNIVENLLLAIPPDDNSVGSTRYRNWKIEKVFESDKVATFSGREIRYNYFKYSCDFVPSGMQEDEALSQTGFVIPYSSSGIIRYIISKNSGALTVLRKLLSYGGKSEVIKNDFQVAADMFVWLISKVYRSENTIEKESDQLADLTIDSIRGFKGDTEDLLTKVSATGETVINIISTLSFLLESQNLNQITLDISYRKHTNIDVFLSKRNTVSIDTDLYQGELFSNRDAPEGVSLVLLTLYTEILPIIIQNYQSEVGSDQWGERGCAEFLSSVAEDLSNKVAKRVEDLTNRPEQLKIDTCT